MAILKKLNRVSPVSPPVAVENRFRRMSHENDLENYDVSVDPFRTFHVSPHDINGFTKRAYPPVFDRYEQLGTVRGGDWDVRDDVEFVSEEYRWRYELYRGKTFVDSIFYRSLENHFVNGKDWRETELVEKSLALVEEGKPAWRGAQSEARILELCSMTDELYRSIRKKGYLSQKELEDGSLRRVIDEVCVDLDRNGQMLFVDGKHRLAIAKILAVDAIPVAVLTRHERWVRELERFEHVNPERLR